MNTTITMSEQRRQLEKNALELGHPSHEDYMGSLEVEAKSKGFSSHLGKLKKDWMSSLIDLKSSPVEIAFTSQRINEHKNMLKFTAESSGANAIQTEGLIMSFTKLESKFNNALTAARACVEFNHHVSESEPLAWAKNVEGIASKPFLGANYSNLIEQLDEVEEGFTTASSALDYEFMAAAYLDLINRIITKDMIESKAGRIYEFWINHFEHSDHEEYKNSEQAVLETLYRAARGDFFMVDITYAQIVEAKKINNFTQIGA